MSTAPQLRADDAADRPLILPPYVLILVILAVLAAMAGQHAGAALVRGRDDWSLPHQLALPIGLFLFDAAVLAILAGAFMLQVAATFVRWARSPRWRGRVFVRLLAGLVPLVAFMVGHAVLSPGTWGLATRLGGVLRNL